MKKVQSPRREKKIMVLEEKQLKGAIGSSGYMVSWGFTDDPNNPNETDNDGGR